MTNVMRAAGGFGADHFGACRLGDRRRTARLVDLADRLRRHPAGGLPAKLRDPAAYRAGCRLMNHPRLTHAAVLEPHRVRTRQAMAAHPGVVPILHDTTELDYSGHHATALGPIGNGGGRGYEAHHRPAVTAEDGRLLGLAAQLLHRRATPPRGEGVAARRARADRESRLWQRGAEAVGPAPPEATWVDVADRGADIFEFLAFAHGHGRSYVVRSAHNRALEDADADTDAGPHLLHDRLRARPAESGRTVAVPPRPGRPRREARVLAARAPLHVRAPHVCRGEHGRAPLAVWAVRVWEPEPPAGAEPLEWLLLSNVPIPDAAMLRRVVGWYERRAPIEEFHKAQKTGLRIEALQFRTAGAPEPAVALLSVVAVALVAAREDARDEATAARPAGAVFDPVAVRVLSTWRHGAARSLSVQEFVLASGRLGGHLNRECDGLPGWLTLWRGWGELQAMIAYELSRARSG